MDELLERLEDFCRLRMRSCQSRPGAWLWSEAYFGVRWIAAWKASHREIPEEFPRIHVREVYHIRDAQPDRCYPLSEADILRLLHTARYGDPFTQNSIQARLNQAMLPDPEDHDVDLERCALDERYLAWARSGQRPTLAFAQELLALMLRRTPQQA